jgi:hypothetical protein
MRPLPDTRGALADAMLLLLLWTAIAPWASAGTPAADRQPLEVRRSGAPDAWLHPTDALDLTLNRPLVAGDERLAILVGTADLSSLFELAGQTLRYRPGLVRLPTGESVVTVYLVTAPNVWQPVATLPIRVTTPRGFESATVTPRISLADNGQIGERHSPEINVPARPQFQDLTFAFGLQTQSARNGVTMATQANVLGVTNQTQAPQFATAGTAARRVDLADYLWTTDARSFKVAVGQGTFGAERHLGTGLASRGLSFTVRRARADVTVAEYNGNQIVGLDNLFGVSTAENRIGLVLAGIELAPHPGAARLEVSALDGSRLTQPGVTQGQVSDTERSKGSAVRFVGQGFQQRVRVDAGFARSAFTNPADPLLSQGATLVPIRSTANNAIYVDSAFDVVKGVLLAPATPLTVTAIYRFERVDPLFASVGAPQGLQSDLFQNVVGASATLRAVTAEVLRTISNDNLGHVASILRTDTGVTAVTFAVPTGSFGQSPAAAAWCPTVSYSLNRSTQIGEALPANGGFVSASQVPNQLNAVHVVRADWQIGAAHAGYALTRSTQDNRQVGRENADFSNLVQAATFGATIAKRVDLIGEAGLERNDSEELKQETRTDHVSVTTAWRMTLHDVLTVIVNDTLGRGPDVTKNDALDLNLQYARTFELKPSAASKPQIRLFGRLTWQSSSSFQVLSVPFLDDRHLLTFGVGATITFF